MVHVGGLWLYGEVLTGHRWVVTFSGRLLSWLVRVSWHCLERVRSFWVLCGVGVDVMQLGLG